MGNSFDKIWGTKGCPHALVVWSDNRGVREIETAALWLSVLSILAGVGLRARRTPFTDAGIGRYFLVSTAAV